MAALIHNVQGLVLEPPHHIEDGLQKHMVLVAHDIQGRNTGIYLFEEFQLFAHVAGEVEPADELLLGQFAGFAHEQAARFFVSIQGHDDEGEEAVEPHVGDEGLEHASHPHQESAFQREAGDGAHEDDGFYVGGCDIDQLADDDGAQRYAYEMGLPDLEMVEYVDDVGGDGLKGVVVLAEGGTVGRAAMSAKINEQEVEMLFIVLDLFEPHRRASSGAVHKHNPVGLLGMFYNTMVEHRVQNLNGNENRFLTGLMIGVFGSILKRKCRMEGGSMLT